MAASDNRESPAANFPVTRWTLIERLRRPGVESHAALDEICRSYWKPLHAHARRLGSSATDAEDVVQDFFRVALHRDLFHTADPRRGRLRSLLLRSFENHLRDLSSRTRAAKRHANGTVVPFEEFHSGSDADATGSTAADVSHGRSPAAFANATTDSAFDHEWALTVVELALVATRATYEREGRAALFDNLKPCLVDPESASADRAGSARLAAQLGIKEASLRVTLHRVRTRFREALRDTVRATLADETGLDEELDYLRQCLTSRPR